MRTSLIAALLAATLLVPASAYAQNGPQIGRQTKDDADRPQRPDRARHYDERDRPDRGQRPQAERPQPPQPSGWQRGDRPAPNFTDRGRRNADRGDGRSDWSGQPGGANGWQDRGDNRRPDWNRKDPNRGNAGWRDRDHDGSPNWHDRDRDGDGVPNWRDRDDRRGDWNRGNNWQDGRGNAYDRGRYENRGNWNRDWRHDNRYDWNRYRAYNRGAYRLPRYYAPHGWGYGYRRFSIGFRLDTGLFGSNYWIDQPYDYRLPPAYGPYRWVRYYNDALLVDVRTGYIVDTVYSIFW